MRCHFFFFFSNDWVIVQNTISPNLDKLPSFHSWITLLQTKPSKSRPHNMSNYVLSSSLPSQYKCIDECNITIVYVVGLLVHDICASNFWKSNRGTNPDMRKQYLLLSFISLLGKQKSVPPTHPLFTVRYICFYTMQLAVI